jgi:hypothetical protein
MGCIKGKHVRSLYERTIVDNLRDKTAEGVITEKCVNNNKVNKLIAKKCQHCSSAMHIHRKDDFITFAGCEPCVVNLRMQATGDKEMTITGRRSTKVVRCQNCHHRHLLSSFEEIKDEPAKD